MSSTCILNISKKCSLSLLCSAVAVNDKVELIILVEIYNYVICYHFIIEQGRKRPLDTPKRMIERRERKVEGEI